MRIRSAPRAFTLVELLVVIGIIALLISILLPTLGKAKAAANTVKCATQMKEIGNAFRLYSIEYRGFYPPAKLQPVAGTYDIGNFGFTNNKPAYWINFIGKYVSKSNAGFASGSAQQASDVRLSSVIWGCPVFEPYNSTTSGVGIQPVQTGYGMNDRPYYSATYPAPANPDTFKAGEIAICQDNPPVTVAWSPGSTLGFIKANVWGIRGAERMLIAESKYFEAYSVKPAGGTTPSGPFGGGGTRPTYVGDQVSDAANATTDGQSYLNFWRHGKLPAREGSGYDISKGRVANNILYCDGHVATSTDAKDGFLSQRMKYPG